MVGLDFADTAVSPAQTTEVDISRAKRIWDRARAKGLRVRRAQRHWGKALGILRRRLGDNESRIDEVLDFIDRVDLQRPLIKDGSHLASPAVWDWLLALMEKDKVANPVTGNICVCATQISSKLSRLIWDRGSKKQLPAVVQLTINRMRAFRERCKSFEGKTRIAQEVADRLAKHLSNSNIEHLALIWVESLHEWVHRWDQWDGDLIKLAWDFRREQCQRYAREYTESYFGIHNDPKRLQAFDVFLKELNHD